MDRNMAAITMQNGQLNVPNNPVVHYIEGDGIGIDITPVMIDVVNAAVEKAYSGEKEIAWNEVLAGEKAFNTTGEWLPEDTLDAIRSGLVSIKAADHSCWRGILNVARQKLDLYAWWPVHGTWNSSSEDLDLSIHLP